MSWTTDQTSKSGSCAAGWATEYDRGAGNPAGDGLILSQVQACEAPAYHLASAIQPHGVLLVLDAEASQIIRASANAGAMLGLEIADLVGSDLSDLLTDQSIGQVRDVAQRLRSDRSPAARSRLVLDIIAPRRCPGTSFIYLSLPYLCIEIEPPGDGASLAEAATLSSRFFDLVDRVGHADTTSNSLATLTCAAIREMTGFDRVYFCRFDRYGHGHVLGESRGSALASLMDHHFPATDIPKAARRIFAINPFRLIADVDALPVAIVGGDGSALDLTLSTCRMVAETHMQYLRNMGVRASVSYSVVADGQLEAIFGGHHSTPRYLSSQQMSMCRHLADLFQTRFDVLKMREERSLAKQRGLAINDLCAGFRLADCDLAAFLRANRAAFCAIMDADDLLWRLEPQTQPEDLPGGSDAGDLLGFLSEKLSGSERVFQTDCLGEYEARFHGLCPAVAGVLAIPLDLSGGGFLVWLRSETIVVKKWSGDPDHAVVFDAQGVVGPRRSFQAYMRESKGSALAWSLADSEVAQELRQALSQVLADRREISMRKAAEQANALKSDFVANISHELRSPMHSIIGFSDRLAAAPERLPQEKQKRYARAINESGHRLLHLIDELLDLSRLEAGKMAFDFTTGDLLITVKRALAGVETLARTKAVAILLSDRRRYRDTLFDTTRMEQVMINLLSNALKFSPPRTNICVTLSTTETGQSSVMLTVEVADQGVGIPPDELDTIFDKFIQSSRTRSGAGGTGLGLAICREIAEAHGGRIWADNNAGGGASLFVEVPQIGSDRNEAAS